MRIIIRLIIISSIASICFMAFKFFISKPRIEVEGIVLEYEVGDEINLNNAVMRYYGNVFSDGEEVFVTEDMIEGFNTETEGTRTLRVVYSGASQEFQYVVRAQASVVSATSGVYSFEYNFAL